MATLTERLGAYLEAEDDEENISLATRIESFMDEHARTVRDMCWASAEAAEQHEDDSLPLELHARYQQFLCVLEDHLEGKTQGKGLFKGLAAGPLTCVTGLSRLSDR
jgi:hypothetical protein